MGRPRKNMVGMRFGALTVTSPAPDYVEPKSKHKRPRWFCKCDCGRTVIMLNSTLKVAKSCGCLKNNLISQSHKKLNTYDLSGEYGKGYDSLGNEFWFDLDDYEKIKDYYWSKYNTGYFVTTYKEDGKLRTLQLHRLILGIENEDYHVIIGDHIHGGNTLHDNRKSNLRVASRRQNAINCAKRNNSSGVTGVIWHKEKRKWIASINDSSRHSIQLGAFDNKDDAIAARKEAEIKYYGDFSYSSSRGDV